jgi:hypothetical protein
MHAAEEVTHAVASQQHSSMNRAVQAIVQTAGQQGAAALSAEGMKPCLITLFSMLVSSHVTHCTSKRGTYSGGPFLVHVRWSTACTWHEFLTMHLT